MERVLSIIALVLSQLLLYYYLWRRLIASTELPAPWRKRLTWLLLGLGLSVPISMALARLAPEVGRGFAWPVMLWLGVFALICSFLAIGDLARLAFILVRKALRSSEMNPERRVFFRRAAGGGAVVAAVAVAGHGVTQALRPPEIVKLPITLDRLPASMDGFTIAQICDVHVGLTIDESFVRGIVEQVNELNADLIVIVGDLVDGKVADLAKDVAPLAELRAEHGVYFVTGNHEYYAGVDPWLAHIEELGIRVLRNERVEIGSEGTSFDLAGVDDHNADRWPGHGTDLPKALEGRDPNRELVLLAHQPRQVHVAREHGVGLQLSGHTHGGQIWPWHYVVMAQQGGLQLSGHSVHGTTQLYVSRGTGYWGPPVRVFAPAEITKITLHAKL